MASFVTVTGTTLTLNGTPLTLRGVNLGNWMLIEAYMIGLPWTDYRMRQAFHTQLGAKAYHAFFDTFMDCCVSEADIAYLSECGLNFLQLPFSYRHFSDDDSSALYEGRGFAYVDRVVAWCRKYDMYVMPSLHAAPGAQVRDWNAESDYGEALFWEHAEFREHACAILERIADRYRDEERVFGYELLNEPLAPDHEAYRSFHLETLRRVRAVDPNHIIVINTDRWGRNPASLSPRFLDDSQVAFTVHPYHRLFPPFDSMEEFPAFIDGKEYGREALVAAIETTIDRDTWPRPWIIGETGSPESRKGPERSVAGYAMWDCLLEHFNQNGYPWTFWAHKDIGVLGLLNPRPESAWNAFLQSPQVKAIRDASTAITSGIQQLADRHATGIFEELDRGLFAGQCRHWLHALTLPRVVEELKKYTSDDLADMARSFAFEQCTANETRERIVRKHARA
jgi:endoglucanase